MHNGLTMTSSPISLQFKARPRNATPLVCSLLGGRPRQAPVSEQGVRFEARWMAAQADPQRLALYRALCGLRDTGNLPPLYLHAMAMPLHLAVMSHARFPMRIPGLVHLSNSMQCLRPIGAGEVLDMQCQMDGIQSSERGQTFTLHTQLSRAGHVAWSESSTFVAPLPRSGPRPAPVTDVDWGPPMAQWLVPADAGRRFAPAAGDWNPIHISALSARLFGYPRAIAHGMFSAARCVAVLQAEHPTHDPVQIDLRFKRPLLIPGEVALHRLHEADQTRFVLKVQPSGEPHVEGTLRPL